MGGKRGDSRRGTGACIDERTLQKGEIPKRGMCLNLYNLALSGGNDVSFAVETERFNSGDDICRVAVHIRNHKEIAGKIHQVVGHRLLWNSIWKGLKRQGFIQEPVMPKKSLSRTYTVDYGEFKENVCGESGFQRIYNNRNKSRRVRYDSRTGGHYSVILNPGMASEKILRQERSNQTRLRLEHEEEMRMLREQDGDAPEEDVPGYNLRRKRQRDFSTIFDDSEEEENLEEDAVGDAFNQGDAAADGEGADEQLPESPAEPPTKRRKRQKRRKQRKKTTQKAAEEEEKDDLKRLESIAREMFGDAYREVEVRLRGKSPVRRKREANLFRLTVVHESEEDDEGDEVEYGELRSSPKGAGMPPRLPMEWAPAWYGDGNFKNSWANDNLIVI